VLQTGADGRLSVTFVDGTIFTLSAGSRMVVDTLIYDPASQANSGSFDLIQGGFVFIAGQVARTGGMEVTTPAATMGIRGTTVVVEIDTQGGVSTAQITLVRDPDGSVGRVELFDLSQNLIGTITEADASWIISTVEGETREVERGADSDEAISLLIAEAIAAYSSALGRVQQGGSFVEIDGGPRGARDDGPDGDGIDLDSNDAVPVPLPESQPETPVEDDNGFDEGRNLLGPPAFILTGVDSGSVADGRNTTADGQLAAVGPTLGSILTWSGSAEGRFGTFDITPQGEWRYTAGPGIVALDEGETALETFGVVITDEEGRTATQTITITVEGAGDDPVPVTQSSDDAVRLVEAVGAAAGGQLTAIDPDVRAVLTWSGSTPGLYGDFRIAPDGTWSFVAGPGASALAIGETATETFTATVTDQTGRSAVQTVTVTIDGGNDAPVPTTPQDEAAVTVAGDSPVLVSGRLSAADPDSGAVLTWSGAAAGTYGTFAVGPDGTWTFAGNALVATLGAGTAATEAFTATVTDEWGATGTQTVVVTILGTNDAPIARPGEIDTTKGSAVTGSLLASDIDEGDVLTFGAGPGTPANGTVLIGADGSFTYTPNPGFQGLDSFDFTVSDGQGGTSSSRVTVAVVAPSATGAGGAGVSLDVSGSPGALPAGTVISTATPVESSGVNIVVALDRSFSIGTQEWAAQIDQVAGALETLAARFAGAATSVDVQIVTYSGTATATRVFDLTDPALITTLRSLPFGGNGTNYTAALTLAEAFFDGQPAGEANFLYFITDGEPTESGWPTVLDRLTDEATKGYEVQIEAFGIGRQIDLGTLVAFDPTPEILSDASALTDAFTATPLFTASIVTLSVELIADGVNQGVIATETSAGVESRGLVTTLPLAEIAGLADLLGTSNRISATAGYDLDGDPETIEIELFASSVFAKADTAQVLTGTAGSDLLLGSDMGDVLTGGTGNDILIGFDGDDVFRPGAGRDTVLAGAGGDRIIIEAPASGGSVLDGGTGRDTIEIGFGGDVNAGLTDLVDLRGIEVIDMRNGEANNLRLALSDVLGMSAESDPVLEALLGGDAPLARTIRGDAADSLVLEGAVRTGSVADGTGNTFDIYSFEGGSDVLATLAVDAEMAVSTQPAGT
jgi:VCBS repeat-containing protein